MLTTSSRVQHTPKIQLKHKTPKSQLSNCLPCAHYYQAMYVRAAVVVSVNDTIMFGDNVPLMSSNCAM